MTRATYRFREYTIRPCPDIEPITSAMECRTCGQISERAEELTDGTEWAAAHLKANPGHLDYREHIMRPYRFEPREWR